MDECIECLLMNSKLDIQFEDHIEDKDECNMIC